MVQGKLNTQFERVGDIFAENLRSGADVGASCCITVDGETVVDIWGGHADAARSRDWDADTIVNVFSTTKTMTALTALLVADRGDLDFAAPVARYWPEFGVNGKEQITVAQLMSHTSGLSGIRTPITTADLCDWDRMTALLAAEAPLWEPGTASGYHAMTFGYLIGEVIRRITGSTLGTIFRKEIAERFDADFHIGLPASEDHRVAELIHREFDTSQAPELTEIQTITYTNMGIEMDAVASRAWRGAEIPAVNGHGNARSIATIHALLANGGTARGVRIMSEAGCRRALDLQIEGPDLVMMGWPARFGLGFGLPGAMLPLEVPNPDTIFWGGYGGSLAIVDMDAHTTFAYAMNKCGPSTVGDQRSHALVTAMWQSLQ